jgi:hypothetical protein
MVYIKNGPCSQEGSKVQCNNKKCKIGEIEIGLLSPPHHSLPIWAVAVAALRGLCGRRGRRVQAKKSRKSISQHIEEYNLQAAAVEACRGHERGGAFGSSACMCIYIYIYIYKTYIHIYTYIIHIYIYTYTYIHTYIHTHIIQIYI